MNILHLSSSLLILSFESIETSPIRRAKGRNYLKCNRPIWADGYVNGKRTLRQSPKTCDMARARKRAQSPPAGSCRRIAWVPSWRGTSGARQTRFSGQPLRAPVSRAIQDFISQHIEANGPARACIGRKSLHITDYPLLDSRPRGHSRAVTDGAQRLARCLALTDGCPHFWCVAAGQAG